MIEAFVAEGPSMEPTVFNGERVAVDKSAYGLALPFANETTVSWAAPQPADIALINSPLDGMDIFKRVVGVPGDLIEIGGDSVFVNGVELPHEPVKCPV